MNQMYSYIKGFLKYFLHKQVSNMAFITDDSFVSSKAVVSRGCKVFKSSIDDYSYCAPNTELVCCQIGKFCSIGKATVIGLASHTISYLSSSPVFTEAHNRLNFSFTEKSVIDTAFSKVEIGNDVWIGDRAIIKGGIKIGNGAIIGTGAVVTKDITPYSIVGGVPSKLIRKRFDDDIINKIERMEWWNWNEEKIKKNIALFQCELKKISEFKIL